jgi:hypothetical protein
VDTGSDQSLIQYRDAKRLGLERFTPLKAVDLTGFGGGGERIIEFVNLEVECPLIGLGRVEEPVYVVRAKEIDGLLIGTPMIDTYKLDDKIVNAKKRRGSFPPGMDATKFASSNNGIIHPIFDGRKKATKNKDREVHSRKASETRETVNTILRCKKAMATSDAVLKVSTTATPSSSGQTICGSDTSAGSVVSGSVVDTGSTVATSVTASISGDST